MANDIITNLHPDNDPNINLYPNIKKENIPSKSISTDKLDDNVLSLIGSLKPSGTDTSTNILAFTSNKGIYVATDNGHWYYWNGSAYVDGGVYITDPSNDEVKGELVEFKNDITTLIAPTNILNPNNVKIGYVRIWNNPNVLVENNQYVTIDFIPVEPNRLIMLDRGNLTLQSPATLVEFNKNKESVTPTSTHTNPRTLSENTRYISISVSIEVYNAWKETLQIEYDEMRTYTPYFEPYYEIRSELVKRYKKMYNSNCISIAHQGLATDGKPYGHSKVESYVNASKNGFDYGETDLIFSSDEVAMCCHDPSFVDATSGETIVISEHTLSELKTYDYYGGKIATFDEVLRTCKENGMGLVIDHVTEADSGTRFTDVMSIVKKYQMQENVIWHVGRESMINTLNTWYPKVRIYVPIANVTDISTILNLYSRFATDKNEVGFSVNTDKYTVDNIISLSAELPARVHVMGWTIDDKAKYKQYLPYLRCIISNKLNTYLLD